jgi:uncharacterized protein YecE (DUF72 family)
VIVRVGQTMLRGDIARYAEHLDLLELRAEPGSLPRPGRLRDWASRVPESFVFSIELPRQVASLEGGPGATRALGYALRAAEALGARWLVLRTPASVTPGRRSRSRLHGLLQQLPRGRPRVAWEPGGLWEDLDAERLAAELQVVLVRDLTRVQPPPGDVLYARLRELGRSSRLGAAAIDRVADYLVGRNEIYLVVESHGTGHPARLLRDGLRAVVDGGFAPRGD